MLWGSDRVVAWVSTSFLVTTEGSPGTDRISNALPPRLLTSHWAELGHTPIPEPITGEAHGSPLGDGCLGCTWDHVGNFRKP